MKWKSLRRDEGVKPAWQKGMNYVYHGLIILIFIRVIIRLIYRSELNNSVSYEIINRVAFFWLILFIIPGLIYLVKPSWFLVNKEQTVEVCDATEAE